VETSPRPHRRARTQVLIAGAVLTTVIAVAPTAARADDGGRLAVHQTNLVANTAGYGAAIVDPRLVNAWGLSKFPTSPVWISDNGTDLTTLYAGGTPAAPATTKIAPLVVSVPGAPTGQVANTSTGFLVGDGKAARFIFATESGDIFGWDPADAATAERKAGSPGAVYKGLALTTTNGAHLLATDFKAGRIDVFDRAWMPETWPGAFKVRHLPKGFAPFNVQVLRDGAGAEHVYVAYAKQDPNSNDELHGRGLGLVVEFTPSGMPVRRFERGHMNAPWGLAYAPSSWGRHAGELLVGQFGDGRIEMFDPMSGEHTGTVRDDHGKPLVIDGLWGLLAADPTAGGAGNVLFTAGPHDEADGLYGVLAPAPVMHGHEHD
jgi:uncharacterized protein (TIGR03118 family)